jgi:hypothetical protein
MTQPQTRKAYQAGTKRSSLVAGKLREICDLLKSWPEGQGKLLIKERNKIAHTLAAAGGAEEGRILQQHGIDPRKLYRERDEQCSDRQNKRVAFVEEIIRQILSASADWNRTERAQWQREVREFSAAFVDDASRDELIPFIEQKIQKEIARSGGKPK